MNEFQRIFNRRILIMILAACVLNAALFVYAQIGRKNTAGISAENQARQWLTEHYSSEQLRTAYEEYKEHSGELYAYYEKLADTDKTYFTSVLKTMLAKAEYISGYQEYVQNTLKQAESQTKFAIFGNKDSYAYNNLKKTEKDFRRVSEVRLSLGNDYAAEQFLSYKYTAYIAFAIMILVIYELFQERENGMWEMVHPSADGRLRLGITRLCILFAQTVGVMFVLYGIVLIASYCLYGGWADLFAPIQTLEQFRTFAYPWNKLTYMGYLLMIQTLAVFALGMAAWMLFCLFRKRNYAVTVIGLFTGIELVLYQTLDEHGAFSILKKVNIAAALYMNQISSVYANCGYGKIVVPVLGVFITVFILLSAAAAVISVARTAYMRPVSQEGFFSRIRGKVSCAYQQIFSRESMVLKELHKLMMTSKGYVFALLAVLVTLYVTQTSKVTYPQTIQKREQAYLEQGGEDYSGLVELVQQRVAEYNEAAALYKTALEQKSQGDATIQEVYDAYNNMLYYSARVSEVKEFQDKITYLETIQEQYGVKGYMISDRGYSEVFGGYADMREMILLLVLTAAVFLIISESSLLESRTGMCNILNTTVNGRAWLYIRKILSGLMITLVLYAVVYGIDYIQLADAYGFAYLSAPLMSLTFMEGCWFGGNIGQWMLFRQGLRLAWMIFVMAAAFGTSKWIGKGRSRAIQLLILSVILIITLVIF